MKNKKIIFKVSIIVLIFSILLTLYSYINDNNLLYSFKWSFIVSTTFFLGLYFLGKNALFSLLGTVMYMSAFIICGKTIIRNIEVIKIIIFNFIVFSEKIKKIIGVYLIE